MSNCSSLFIWQLHDIFFNITFKKLVKQKTHKNLKVINNKINILAKILENNGILISMAHTKGLKMYSLVIKLVIICNSKCYYSEEQCMWMGSFFQS